MNIKYYNKVYNNIIKRFNKIFKDLRKLYA